MRSNALRMTSRFWLTALVLALTSAPAASGLRQLTTAAGIDSEPTWSPSGKYIAFSSERYGSSGMDLWIMAAPGGFAFHTTFAVSNEYGASWSPDGSTIAYYWAGDGKIYFQSLGGGEPTVFTPGKRGESEPAWSPDGTRIAFASTGPVVGGAAELDIWVREVESGVEHRVTSDPGVDRHPTWSPDGKTLAFMSDREGSFQLWSVPVVGGQPKRLSEMSAEQPAWSPRGGWIAFVSDFDVYLIAPSGGPATPLTSGPELDFAPAWSPDGQAIVFMRRVDGEADLWITDTIPVSVRETSWSAMKKRYRKRDE